MSILGAVIVPHPPLIIPTVGRGREQEVQATIDAYHTVAEQVTAWGPEVLIITLPHQIMYGLVALFIAATCIRARPVRLYYYGDFSFRTK